jgi:hypothetical protein
MPVLKEIVDPGEEHAALVIQFDPVFAPDEEGISDFFFQPAEGGGNGLAGNLQFFGCF